MEIPLTTNSAGAGARDTRCPTGMRLTLRMVPDVRKHPNGGVVIRPKRARREPFADTGA